jgi:hypothetical protein
LINASNLILVLIALPDNLIMLKLLNVKSCSCSLTHQHVFAWSVKEHFIKLKTPAMPGFIKYIL